MIKIIQAIFSRDNCKIQELGSDFTKTLQVLDPTYWIKGSYLQQESTFYCISNVSNYTALSRSISIHIHCVHIRSLPGLSIEDCMSRNSRRWSICCIMSREQHADLKSIAAVGIVLLGTHH